ncbi:MAG TPA: hypothetical protein VFU71_01730 [Burkholderiaceae bacterium]|nr:hypothetical protein [Burkholderiaceae bacterium]
MNWKHTAFVGAFTLTACATSLAQAPWYPSKWGANDEIGAANYLSAQGAKYQGAVQAMINPIGIR